MPDAPTLPVYPQPVQRKPVSAPAGIPLMSHPGQGKPIQKMVGKMFNQKFGRKQVPRNRSAGRNKKGMHVASDSIPVKHVRFY